jgi:signal transduction histidine kinase
MSNDNNQSLAYKQIFKLGQIITSEINLDKLFDVIMEQINKIMRTEKCSIFLHDPDSDELYCQVSTDLKKNEIRISTNHGVSGWVFQNQEAQIINDPYSDPRFIKKIDKAAGVKTRNLMCIPLINRSNVCIGTLQTLNKKESQFSDDDKDLLTAASHYVVISLENAKLYKELKLLDKARERVVDHISHELKTPVSIILAVLNTLKKRLVGTEHIKKLDKTIQRGLRNINRLIELQEKTDDILTKDAAVVAQNQQYLVHFIESTVFLLNDIQDKEEEISKLIALLLERIEAVIPQEKIIKEEISAKIFIEKICNYARNAMGNRKVAIVCEVNSDLCLFMDKSVLTKTCRGLLKNAIENTPDQGTIIIEAESVNGKIEIKIKDSGVGITRENQNLIFGGFFHTQETSLYASKTPYEFNAGGSGADLLRIKTLAERHGFSIDFESIRCKFLPQDMDICPGNIEECNNIVSSIECQSAGGSIFTLQFQTEP